MNFYVVIFEALKSTKVHVRAIRVIRFLHLAPRRSQIFDVRSELLPTGGLRRSQCHRDLRAWRSKRFAGDIQGTSQQRGHLYSRRSDTHSFEALEALEAGNENFATSQSGKIVMCFRCTVDIFAWRRTSLFQVPDTMWVYAEVD
eukprot:IDg11275t1